MRVIIEELPISTAIPPWCEGYDLTLRGASRQETPILLRTHLD